MLNAQWIDDYAAAFNAGCDARLAGLPDTANPHSSVVAGYTHFKWRQGWLDVDKHWGLLTRGRPVRPLPEVAACR